MKKIILSVIAISAILISISSCKKKEVEPEKSVEELLQAKPWTIVSDVYYYTNSGVELSETYFYDACDQDDKDVYTADGKLINIAGPTQCNRLTASDYRNDTLQYELIENKAKLIKKPLVGRRGSIDTFLISVDKTSLTLTLTRKGRDSRTVYNYKNDL